MSDFAMGQRLRGISASPGIAGGALFIEHQVQLTQRVEKLPPDQHQSIFTDAIKNAAKQLRQIMGALEDQDATDIIEFQLAMIEDDSLLQPVILQIARGVPANQAWVDALNNEIEDYQNAEDEYFRARAADLRDIRDRVCRAITGTENTALPPNSIVICEDITPSRFLETRWGDGGIALTAGSINSHVAMLARSRQIPMLVSLEGMPDGQSGTAVLDANDGILLTGVDQTELDKAHSRIAENRKVRQNQMRYLDQQPVFQDGSRIQVYLNVAHPAELDSVDATHCDGVGLVRTEFLFNDRDSLPDEEEQLQVYQRIIEWAGGNPVTIRTLDAGGDKPVHGLTLDGEPNPFLGVRGIRLSLQQPEVFLVQLRALLRAATIGPLKVMLPMVTIPEEVEQTRKLMAEAAAQLTALQRPFALPALGIMVEVPSAALCIERFDVDFYSIGSNDLVQYVTACSRDSAILGHIAKPDNPAVLGLIENVIEHGKRSGKEISLCGEMAGESRYIDLLLRIGLRCFSVSGGALAATKACIIESNS